MKKVDIFKLKFLFLVVFSQIIQIHFPKSFLQFHNLKISFNDYSFNEFDIQKNELRIVNNKIFVNINGKHKEFNICDIVDIEMMPFSDELYRTSLDELRDKVNSLYLKLEKKKNDA